MAKLDSGAMTIGNNDNWREIFDDQNATAVAANQATADLAPIINGKRCALSVASGGFVLLRNSTITGKADGAYTAAKAIPANTDLDGSYLTAISGGVANALNGNLITVTNWNCQSNENWSANSWSHIGGGGIPSSAIPSGKTISANLIGMFAVSTASGWTRIVANLRTDAVNDIALSVYSNVAGNTNSIKFKALWL